jgi:hypothetical protein
MSKISRAFYWAVALTAALAVGASFADEKKPKKPTVMQRKLQNAQLVLEGLAKADFEKIGKGADGLLVCVRDASWRAVKAPKYELYSNEFLRHIETLKKAAKKKNNDAAALAYVEMTLTCVKCHQHLRDERIGAAPSPARHLAHFIRRPAPDRMQERP